MQLTNATEGFDEVKRKNTFPFKCKNILFDVHKLTIQLIARSLTNGRGSWVVGTSRGSWVWVWVILLIKNY